MASRESHPFSCRQTSSGGGRSSFAPDVAPPSTSEGKPVGALVNSSSNRSILTNTSAASEFYRADDEDELE